MPHHQLRLRPRDSLFEAVSARTLATVLEPFQTAATGTVVAIHLFYSDAYPRPLREGAAGFVFRTAAGIDFVAYADLPDDARPGLVDAVMRLEEDESFDDHVRHCLSEMRDCEGDNYHEILVTADAIGFVRPDVAKQSGTWCEARLEQFCRLLPRRAQSAHEAIGRHDDLVGLIRLWRLMLAKFDCEVELPHLVSPTVSDLLERTD